jgi:hypothetical protein
LNKQRLQPNFGNAGSVNTLITSALAKAANRPPMADGSIEIRPEDLVDGEETKSEEPADPMAPLDKLYRFVFYSKGVWVGPFLRLKKKLRKVTFSRIYYPTVCY